MPADEDDWRLRNQERYLMGAALVWREWSSPPASDALVRRVEERTEWEAQGWEPHEPRELLDDLVECAEPRGWDQDHCDFCWRAFAAPQQDVGDPGSLTAGYTLGSSRRASPWICPTCFEDFRERFGWTVVCDRSD